MGYPLENALFQWEEGWRQLQAVDEPKARHMADLYGRGTDWCQQVAIDVAPGIEGDSQMLGDAAFWLYLRGATDFAGGRQLIV